MRSVEAMGYVALQRLIVAVPLPAALAPMFAGCHAACPTSDK